MNGYLEDITKWNKGERFFLFFFKNIYLHFFIIIILFYYHTIQLPT